MMDLPLPSSAEDNIVSSQKLPELDQFIAQMLQTPFQTEDTSVHHRLPLTSRGAHLRESLLSYDTFERPTQSHANLIQPPCLAKYHISQCTLALMENVLREVQDESGFSDSRSSHKPRTARLSSLSEPLLAPVPHYETDTLETR